MIHLIEEVSIGIRLILQDVEAHAARLVADRADRIVLDHRQELVAPLRPNLDSYPDGVHDRLPNGQPLAPPAVSRRTLVYATRGGQLLVIPQCGPPGYATGAASRRDQPP